MNLVLLSKFFMAINAFKILYLDGRYKSHGGKADAPSYVLGIRVDILTGLICAFVVVFLIYATVIVIVCIKRNSKQYAPNKSANDQEGAAQDHQETFHTLQRQDSQSRPAESQSGGYSTSSLVFMNFKVNPSISGSSFRDTKPVTDDNPVHYQRRYRERGALEEPDITEPEVTTQPDTLQSDDSGFPMTQPDIHSADEYSDDMAESFDNESSFDPVAEPDMAEVELPAPELLPSNLHAPDVLPPELPAHFRDYQDIEASMVCDEEVEYVNEDFLRKNGYL